MSLIDKVLANFEKTEAPANILCRVYLLRIEHTYYKLDVNVLKSIQQQIKQSEDKRAHKDDDNNTEKPSTTTETAATDDKTEGKDGATATSEPSLDGDAVKTTPTKADVADAELINRLCKYIYTNGSDRIRTRAMLCQIFHHARHDRWYEARDLMLISHLQETIQHSDILTQVSCLNS